MNNNKLQTNELSANKKCPSLFFFFGQCWEVITMLLAVYSSVSEQSRSKWSKHTVVYPSTISTPHSKFQLNRERDFDIWTIKNWLSFFVFLLFISVRKLPLPLAKLFAIIHENNTNMLSRPQCKPCMARSWKLRV